VLSRRTRSVTQHSALSTQHSHSCEEWLRDLLASPKGPFELREDADAATRWRVLMYEAWLREQ